MRDVDAKLQDEMVIDDLQKADTKEMWEMATRGREKSGRDVR